ncbi:MAG TPA: CoA transferase [Candidatus Acidoferrales bacterium]|jgi:crotonobetainyl-CoA:carnitine CoA-transferase CaiB-like acyl-CoA transferase|nr:CoA transferase [Candidatus Acidoferrales bacterium]
MNNSQSTEKRMAPLEDITVLDLTVALAGPVATLLLGGLGARVIKIENTVDGDPCRNNPPYIGAGGVSLSRKRPDDISLSAVNRLRNKLGVTLNLKHEMAREVFADLVRKADMLVQNFSPGVLDRLGIGYEVARKINPRIVYCSISGFGSDAGAGPTKALDTAIQALSGIMNVSGEEGEPPVRIGLPIADLSVALFAVIGVLAALHQARNTGAGQHVDVSMLGSLTSLVAAEPWDAMEMCGASVRTGQSFQRLAPFGVFPSKDGYVAICAYTDAFAHALFRIMGREDLSRDERFGTRDRRVANFRALDAIIGEWTSSLATHEIMEKLHAADIPAAEVRDAKTAMHDPRTVARHDTVPLLHPKYQGGFEAYGMGMPIKFSSARAEFDQPPPELGQHNDHVYREILGYDGTRIAQLKENKVI